MAEIKLIDLKQEIMVSNDQSAAQIRRFLQEQQLKLINLMGSPGCGKTSLLLQTITHWPNLQELAVIEGDIDSLVDSEKIQAAGALALQINTGGACHLDAEVVQKALEDLPCSELKLIFVENIGNLVCPAEFDIGENLKVMILSVPEGDDKILKYPLMFTVADVLIINKIDYLPEQDFSISRLKERAGILNPQLKIFEVSSKTRQGIAAWIDYLQDYLKK
ncbi:MAG: hydrogenase nickel incorporation protein HypB [Clostridia bacterium]|nr:hydrogenase nickel incorporation protein HypB [Clostridia bacterium]